MLSTPAALQSPRLRIAAADLHDVRPSAVGLQSQVHHCYTLLQVEHFSIPQIVLTEGCYSGGRVTVCALPVELLGPDNLHTWPLRRLEGKVSPAELADHVGKELSKVWWVWSWK
jgi:hypothetical protein